MTGVDDVAPRHAVLSGWRYLDGAPLPCGCPFPSAPSSWLNAEPESRYGRWVGVVRCKAHRGDAWWIDAIAFADIEKVGHEALFGDVVSTLDGCEAEPDGQCEHGYPTWSVAIGMDAPASRFEGPGED